MAVLDRHMDWIAGAAIVALLILRDNGVLVLSADTLLYMGAGGTVARAAWERRKRGQVERTLAVAMERRPDPPPSLTDTPDGG